MEEEVSERRKAFAAAHRSDEDRQAYISASRRASSVIAKAKAEAWQTTCSSLSPRSNHKSVHSLLRSIAGSPSSSSSSPNFPNGSSPRESASIYAAYLRSHFSVSQPKAMRSRARGYLSELHRATCPVESHSSFCSTFSPAEFLAAASNLTPSTATGPDKVAYPMLKHLPRSGMDFLLYIFNLSWSSHSFPSIWKTSSIIPIHKIGKPLDSPASFRPISLTSCVSKLFECIILSRLLFFLESNSILSPRQAGFRPGRSKLDQILYLSQSISDGFNKPRPGSRTILSTIDFSKAFDSVWHPTLFHKLISAGLPPCFARWTQSFLSDRRACVVHQNHKSRSFRLRRGVPQGSVLGRVLFSLFINDLPASLPSSVSCSVYADDLAIWSSPPLVPTVVEATQEALFRLERWSEYWCLPLNPSKCEASFFSVDPHQANLQPNLLLLGSRLHFNQDPADRPGELLRPLTRSCFLLLLLGRLFLLALPVLLGICLRSRWSPPFRLHALALIPLFLAKVRLSPTLTLPPFMILYSGQMALFLFLLARAAPAFLPTALSVAPRPLFPFRQAQYVPVFPLKPAPFCMLSAGLGSTHKSAISLLFSYYLTLVLSLPPCPLLHLFSYLKLCGRSGRNCLPSPPVLSGYTGSPDTRFSRGTMRLTSLLDGERCLRPPQSLVVSLLLSLVYHSRLFSDWRRTVSSKYFDTQVPLISTEELVLPLHARCVLSRLRCNGHSLLVSSYLSRIGRIENPSCSACGHPSQDISHLILHCPATDSLRRSLFGDSLSLYDLWSRPWGVAWLLGLHGLPPCPHPSEGVG